jgi:hypothetical protein
MRDFTPAEIGLAKSHGCRPITLGPIVLRSVACTVRRREIEKNARRSLRIDVICK